MKIRWLFSKQNPNVAVAVLNEAYFRFSYNALLRVDCQEENDMNSLDEEQKTLFEKLSELKNFDGIQNIFKKVIFKDNKLLIQLTVPWNSNREEKVTNMISWSWPQFFLDLNPG